MARRHRNESKSNTERPPVKTDGPRLFIAAPLPPAVTDQLGHLIDDLSSRELPVRWTATNAMHLTLHFIGEVPPERAELLRMSFANLAPRLGPIKLRTGGTGVFPNPRRPRVLWVGVDGQTDRLASLRDAIGVMLDRLDVEVESGRFRPHLTLGRARDGVDQLFAYQLQQAFESSSVQEIVASPVEFTVDDVVLYRSHLEKSGARYEPLASVRL
ncbi:MAG: RNA 2',3'-cyclic phosphodiesterase [Thermomicrobiales bacterium]|nr:RNA 2',3'-cyclic phosphodiesterase [Thermomicrobiales bacterium]MCO5221886.1 RNA 2',3'-cyclic phosphodiesterase [Thermomicrobiales bacterium]